MAEEQSGSTDGKPKRTPASKTNGNTATAEVTEKLADATLAPAADTPAPANGVATADSAGETQES